MSRKSLILCLSVLAAMIVGIGIAVAFLYSGTSAADGHNTPQTVDGDCCLLLGAVPSDAVLVASFGSTQKAVTGVLSGFDVPALLDEKIADGTLSGLKRNSMLVSLHYSGKLLPLYVFEVAKAGDEKSKMAEDLMGFLTDNGLCVEYVDCSEVDAVPSKLAKCSIVVASASESLVKSSLRHLRRGVSVADAPGFAKALACIGGSDALFVSNAHVGRLLPAMLQKKYYRYSDFLSSVSDWVAMDMGVGQNSSPFFIGSASYDSDPSDFMNVLAALEPARSEVGKVLPSYTLFASSVDVRDIDAYVGLYRKYLDSRQKLQEMTSSQNALKKQIGMSPVDLMHHLRVAEVARASFVAGSAVRNVNLMRVSSPDPAYIFKGTDVKSLKGYTPAVHQWSCPGLLASVFGQFFMLKDETAFTYIDGWVVTGEKDAVEEYVNGKAREYTLDSYMKDAGRSGLLETPESAFMSYVSISEAIQPSAGIFNTDFSNKVARLTEDCDCACALMEIGKGKRQVSLSMAVHRLALEKTKAPVFERDTVVVVPKGPFVVKNSGTGKDNQFYQNSHLSLCLRQDGKDLWGVPFKLPLCGTASNVDYYANGKLQIVFGAGSSIYMIDRLGRYVSGFPVGLGKEILLGPAVYDFNGSKKYNALVLHKDNTIEMYNLKGQKPAAWKGITAGETIKGLPEMLKVGGKTFWVVRTSIQTLVFPFYGGAPLTTFEGDKMIRTDSEVKVMDETSVEVSCYDGKKRKIVLK